MEENIINEKIGMKLLSFRKNRGLTRVKMAKMLDMTHQQLDKYERGLNKISATKLYVIAKKLQLDISYFYDEKYLSTKNKNNNKEEELSQLLLKYFLNIKSRSNKELILQITEKLSHIK